MTPDSTQTGGADGGQELPEAASSPTGSPSPPGEAPQGTSGQEGSSRWERWGRALLDLAALDTSDFACALEHILRVDAATLEVERVSFWSMRDDPEMAIQCEGMFLRSRRICAGGQRLLATQFPRYFHALAADPVVVANDARSDPRTRGFSTSYLEPAGIESMMDVPVWANGALAGVLCHEHVGSKRRWTVDESRFALAVGQIVAAACERRALRGRLQAEQEATRSLTALSALAHGVRDRAIFVLSTDGHVRTWNVGARAVYGWGDEQIRARPLSTFYPPDAVARGEPERDLALAAAQGSVELEGWRVTRDGARFWANVVLTALRDEHGELIGYADVVRDATARRTASLVGDVSLILLSSLDYEQSLRAATRRLVPFFADWCAVDLLERDGAPGTRRVALAHVASAKEQHLASLVGQCPPPLGSDHPIAAALRRGEAQVFARLDDAELGRLCADRRQTSAVREVGAASLMMVPLAGLGGDTLGALTLAARAERLHYGPDELALAEQLAMCFAHAVVNGRAFRRSQDEMHAREEFLSIASHELRTPLTPLRLELDSARRYVAAHDTEPTLARKLESARRQVERLTGLVDRLLDVSRLVTGKLTLDVEPLELGEVVAEIAHGLEESATSQGAPIRLRLRTAAHGRWDRARLEQVVANLLSNAVKYGRGQPIDVIVETRGDRAFLVVHDRGIGIAPGDLRRIFDRFERAVSPHEYGGLGLGLYVARQVVEAHGGRIWATSMPGRGSTFVVELPLAERAAESPPPPLH